jgi:hypothetical protein
VLEDTIGTELARFAAKNGNSVLVFIMIA